MTRNRGSTMAYTVTPEDFFSTKDGPTPVKRTAAGKADGAQVRQKNSADSDSTSAADAGTSK